MPFDPTSLENDSKEAFRDRLKKEIDASEKQRDAWWASSTAENPNRNFLLQPRPAPLPETDHYVYDPRGAAYGRTPVDAQGKPIPSIFEGPSLVQSLTSKANAEAHAAPAEHPVSGPPAPPGPMVFAQPPATAPAAAGIGLMGPRGGGGAPANPFKAYFDSLESQKGAMGDVSRAEQQMVDDQGIAAGLKGQSYGEQVRDMMAKAQSRDEQAAKVQGEVDAASKRASELKEDPDRWWKGQGTADKVRLTLASALGGFLSGYRGGPNQALQQINQHIDRDIAAQRKDIEQAHGRVADMKGSLAEMYRRFGNMEQAEGAARILHLQQLDQEAQEHGASAKSDLVRANADLASRQFQSEIEKTKASMAAKAGGGTDPRAAILKRAQEIANASGGTISVDAAMGRAADEYRAAYGGSATGNTTTYAKPAPGGEIKVGEAPGSTNPFAHPIDAATAALGIQGSAGNDKRVARDQYNADIMGYAHKAFGARTPEAQREIMGGFIIAPNDDERTIARKKEAFMSKYGHGAAPMAPPPEGFEEDK
jgi:hypothetical protein